MVTKLVLQVPFVSFCHQNVVAVPLHLLCAQSWGDRVPLLGSIICIVGGILHLWPRQLFQTSLVSKEQSCHRSSGADSETGQRGTASRLGIALCVFLEYINVERESIVFSNVRIDLLHWRYSNYSLLHMQTSKLAFGATSKRCKHSMFDLESF